MIQTLGSIKVAKCDQCGHDWTVRGESLPIRCVSDACRSKRWNAGAKPKAKKAAKPTTAEKLANAVKIVRAVKSAAKAKKAKATASKPVKVKRASVR